MEKFGSDPAFIEAMTKEMNDFFAASGPVNGRLNEAGYCTWMSKLQEAGEARGNFEDRREAEIKKTYATINKITPGEDGVSMADFEQVMGAWMGIFAELKAADGQ